MSKERKIISACDVRVRLSNRMGLCGNRAESQQQLCKHVTVLMRQSDQFKLHACTSWLSHSAECKCAALDIRNHTEDGFSVCRRRSTVVATFGSNVGQLNSFSRPDWMLCSRLLIDVSENCVWQRLRANKQNCKELQPKPREVDCRKGDQKFSEHADCANDSATWHFPNCFAHN